LEREKNECGFIYYWRIDVSVHYERSLMAKKYIHDADCYTEIRRVDGHSYMELVWNCVDKCPIGGDHVG
jgi:hypothetical protein